MRVAAAASPDIVRETARLLEPDRYVAALLAPREARADLIALAAYLGEVARVPAVVSEPMIGEIRLQWWRDAIEASPKGEPTGNPVADAVADVVRRRRLPIERLTDVIDARITDLYADPVPDEEAFSAYLEATEGTGFRLAARILGVEAGSGEDAAETLTAAAEAYGLVRVLLALPMHRARSRSPFPATLSTTGEITAGLVASCRARARGRLLDAQHALSRVPSADLRARLTAAVLPAALVEPYLRALQAQDSLQGVAQPADVSPLERAWRLWRVHRSGRFAN